MHYDVIEARRVKAYQVWLKFRDGTAGTVDLRSEIWGEVFEPLKDPAYFAAFRVDRTLTWPNGADFAPEFLYDTVTESARKRPRSRPNRGKRRAA